MVKSARRIRNLPTIGSKRITLGRTSRKGWFEREGLEVLGPESCMFNLRRWCQLDTRYRVSPQETLGIVCAACEEHLDDVFKSIGHDDPNYGLVRITTSDKRIVKYFCWNCASSRRTMIDACNEPDWGCYVAADGEDVFRFIEQTIFEDRIADERNIAWLRCHVGHRGQIEKQHRNTIGGRLLTLRDRGEYYGPLRPPPNGAWTHDSDSFLVSETDRHDYSYPSNTPQADDFEMAESLGGEVAGLAAESVSRDASLEQWNDKMLTPLETSESGLFSGQNQPSAGTAWQLKVRARLFMMDHVGSLPSEVATGRDVPKSDHDTTDEIFKCPISASVDDRLESVFGPDIIAAAEDFGIDFDLVRVVDLDLDARVVNALAGGRIYSLGECARLSDDVLYSVRNLGPRSLAQLRQAASDLITSPERYRAMSKIHGGMALLPPSDSNADGIEAQERSSSSLSSIEYLLVKSLRTVAAWAAAEEKAPDLIAVFDVARRGDPAPAEVARASEILASIDIEAFAGEEYAMYDVDASIERLFGLSRDGNSFDQQVNEFVPAWTRAGSFDDRELEVLFQRLLALGKKPTLAQMGSRWHVSRERVRQVESKAEEKLRDILNEPQNKVINRAARRLRSEIGSVIPLKTFQSRQEVDIITEDSAASRENFKLRLLLWLAGPYEIVDGWLAVAPLGAVKATTVQVLDTAICNVSTSVDKVTSALAEVDIHRDHVKPWIEYIGGFRFIEDSLVRWSGTFADKAEIILTIAGAPLTRDELIEAIGEGHHHGTASNYLGSDARFLRTGLKYYGLRTWDLEEYSSIEEELEQVIGRLGGEASASQLVTTLTASFGVTENSVHGYLRGPNFTRTRQGTYRVASPAEARAVRARPITLTKKCYRVSESWAYRITVTDETFRGSGSRVPIGYLAHAGIVPGTTRTFDSEISPIKLTWSSIQTHVSSLKQVAEDLGANVGDYLFVSLLSESEVGFSLVSRASILNASGLRRLVLEVGGEPTGNDDFDLHAVAHAVGLDLKGTIDIGVLQLHLRSRGEDDLAGLLDGFDDRRGEDDHEGIDDLLKMFSI